MNTHYTLCSSEGAIGAGWVAHGFGDLLSARIHAPAHLLPALLRHVAASPVTLRAEGGQLGVCHSQGLLLTLGQGAGSYSRRHLLLTYWTVRAYCLHSHLILISSLTKTRILNLKFLQHADIRT